MKKPKRLMIANVVDDGETVRLSVSCQERIGDVWVQVSGQTDDGISLPAEDSDQWQRDMAVWLLEHL